MCFDYTQGYAAFNGFLRYVALGFIELTLAIYAVSF